MTYDDVNDDTVLGCSELFLVLYQEDTDALCECYASHSLCLLGTSVMVLDSPGRADMQRMPYVIVVTLVCPMPDPLIPRDPVKLSYVRPTIDTLALSTPPGAHDLPMNTSFCCCVIVCVDDRPLRCIDVCAARRNSCRRPLLRPHGLGCYNNPLYRSELTTSLLDDGK